MVKTSSQGPFVREMPPRQRMWGMWGEEAGPGADLFPVISSHAQSCPILCDPIECSLPGSSVHGILQARILEWVATPSSRGSS